MVAYNTSQALDALKKKTFDIILTEHMNGFELAEKIKNDNPDIKIITISGYNDQINSVNSMIKHYDKYLEKPVSGTRILEAVDLVLKQ